MGRRDELIQLLGELLSRIQETRDPSQALAPAVLAVAADLADSLDEQHSLDVEARYLLGWLTWHQAEALPDPQRQAAIDNALELLSPAASQIGQLGFPEPLLPALGDLAMPELAAMVQHATANRDTALLTEVIVRCGNVLEVAPATQPEFARRASFLGVALLTRFQQTGDDGDIDNAAAAVRRAVELGADDRQLDMYLSNLCAILKTRYEHTRDVRDLDEAIAIARRSVPLATQDKLAGTLSNLSAVLILRFELASSPADLTEATDAAQRAVAIAHPTDPHRPAMLTNLTKALHQGFNLGSPAADLDEAVRAGRLAVQAGEGQPDAEMFLRTSRPCAEQVRPEWAGGRPGRGHRGRSAARRAHPRERPVRAGRLIRLAANLSTRFARTGDLADLDELVSVNRQAVEADPGGSAWQTSLGTALLERYEKAQRWRIWTRPWPWPAERPRPPTTRAGSSRWICSIECCRHASSGPAYPVTRTRRSPPGGRLSRRPRPVPPS